MRPDIAFVISRLSTYNAAPTRRYYAAAIGLLRYLKGSLNCRIEYRKEIGGLKAYTNADFAACTDTRRSTIGVALLLASAAIY